MGNPVFGRFIVFLYSFATWTPSISRAQKSARPSCWDEALVSHFACDHPASGSSAKLGWPVSAATPSAPTCGREAPALGPQLRGDLATDAKAGSHHPRSLPMALSEATCPLHSLRGCMIARSPAPFERWRISPRRARCRTDDHVRAAPKPDLVTGRCPRASRLSYALCYCTPWDENCGAKPSSRLSIFMNSSPVMVSFFWR